MRLELLCLLQLARYTSDQTLRNQGFVLEKQGESDIQGAAMSALVFHFKLVLYL